jgi:transcriptional regulator with XRE-family HTH domain
MPENVLGSKLKKLRKEKQLTQDQLGKKLSLSGRYIGKIEAGMLKPSMETFRKMADFFQVPIEYLVSEDETSNNLATATIRNKALLDAFAEVDKMNSKDQELVLGLIDAVIMKNKMKALLEGK